jgi:hypothetical protein
LQDFTLCEALIAFNELMQRHTGAYMADVMFDAIKFYGLENKVKMVSASPLLKLIYMVL